MNCPHYVCLFEPLAEDGAYTQFWCSCGLAVRVGHPRRHYFAVLHHRSSSVGFHLGLFNPIFILKQFQTAPEVLISARCSSQRLPLPTVQVPVEIHATVDEIILTDISSWADLPAKTKREQIVRSLGKLQSRMRQYIINVDREATHVSDQGQDAGAFVEEEERLLHQFLDMRASSTQVHVVGAQEARRKSFWYPLLVVNIENLDCFSKDVSPKLQKGKVHEHEHHKQDQSQICDSILPSQSIVSKEGLHIDK